MNLEESIRFGRALVGHPAFEPQPGMRYFLMTDSGRIHGCGVIERIDSKWGPISKGSPVNEGWIPDFRDDVTYDLCLGCLARNLKDLREFL